MHWNYPNSFQLGYLLTLKNKRITCFRVRSVVIHTLWLLGVARKLRWKCTWFARRCSQVRRPITRQEFLKLPIFSLRSSTDYICKRSPSKLITIVMYLVLFKHKLLKFHSLRLKVLVQDSNCTENPKFGSPVFCRGRDILAKKCKCCIQNRLGAPCRVRIWVGTNPK